MSLSKIMTESVNSVIQEFIAKVSLKYNIEKSVLNDIWNGDNKGSTTGSTTVVSTSTPVPSSEKKPLDHAKLLKCTKPELAALCKTNGYKCTGTKEILLCRLLGKEEVKTEKSASKSPSKTASKKQAQAAVESTPAVKKLTSNIENIIIRKNKFNNFEHAPTGLVFDNQQSRMVIGKQKDDGSIEKLTDADIEMCHAYKFNYDLPLDLDTKSSLADVKIDELETDKNNDKEVDEDEEIEIEEDDEEEEDEEEIEDDN